MKRLFLVVCLFFSSLAWSATRMSIHHVLQVNINPALKQLIATDKMVLPFPALTQKVWLNKNLQISSVQNGEAEKVGVPSAQQQEQEWLLHFTQPQKSFVVQYSGVVFDPIVDDQSSGLISAEGASLLGSSFWYPVTDSFVSFELQMKIPDGWNGLTQGVFEGTSWKELQPQDEIVLLAAPFVQYKKTAGNHQYTTFLRKTDPDLAKQFLDLTPGYIEEYEKWIGPYPYQNFSIVENFWETGFGLPSMTLLGSSVIRLPFILHSSYPHEILHNWWGNSVYVDYDNGNWSEGLTTYMADHHEQEKIGLDHVYRLKTLISYMDYATGGEDFPLRKFVGRHSNSTQAVGYGKSMMMFHMLKVRFGDKAFAQAMQDFYQKNKFHKASFNEIQDSFESVTHENLSAFFTQWLDRTGAPELTLSSAGKWRSERGYYLSINIGQKSDQPYDLTIPVFVKLKNGQTIRQNARLSSKVSDITLELNDNPVSVEVDPNFEVMRLLSPEEKPATISNLFGSQSFVVIHEQNDADAKNIAQIWQAQLQNKFTDLVIQNNTLQIPTDSSILVTGSSQIILDFMKKNLKSYNIEVSNESITIEQQIYDLKKHSFVLTMKNPQNLSQVLVWVKLQQETSAQELAGRLLHYGQFSGLVFKDKPNVYKSTWLSPNSPLKRSLERE